MRQEAENNLTKKIINGETIYFHQDGSEFYGIVCTEAEKNEMLLNELFNDNEDSAINFMDETTNEGIPQEDIRSKV